MNFDRLIDNLATRNHSIISKRYKEITKIINREYWGINSEIKNSRFVGSYGRGTKINGFSDVDIACFLPEKYYERFDSYSYNGQSSLIQNLKGVIDLRYPSTIKAGDGQVVVVEFSDGIKFEIIPAFLRGNVYLYPNTHDMGSWGKTDALLEINFMKSLNKISSGKLKGLCKISRAWKQTNNIKIKGIVIDILATNYMYYWIKKGDYIPDYELLFSGFMLYLCQNANKDSWRMLDVCDTIFKGDMGFWNESLEAAEISLKAMDQKKKGYDFLSLKSWEGIFGKMIY